MLKILIIEDHELNAQLLTGICEDVGKFDITHVETLGGARAALAETSYAVIFWDHNLGQKNTLDLLTTTRKRLPATIMFAMSGNAEIRKLQLEAGCNHEVDPWDAAEKIPPILRTLI